GPARPATAGGAGGLGDGGGGGGRAPGKWRDDLRREARLDLLVRAGPPYLVAFPAPRPRVLVGQALLFGQGERLIFHQYALPFVPLAAAAPAHHHRRQAAGFGGAASQSRVTRGQEDQVVQVCPRQAQ